MGTNPPPPLKQGCFTLQAEEASVTREYRESQRWLNALLDYGKPQVRIPEGRSQLPRGVQVTPNVVEASLRDFDPDPRKEVGQSAVFQLFHSPAEIGVLIPIPANGRQRDVHYV